ncbi:MAG: TetR/AcrR family transcriptional regulator [Clostridiales bacterium]|nr:TetR/AcrR family transcriptional regulator [Clostridiales bacterium]
MPKQRITREMVVDAAFAITRQEGIAQVLVKRIAQELGCSVQPIYSYCNSMDELRAAVAEKAAAHMQAYMAAHIDPADMFRSTGYAYVRYARQEPHLFQLFLQRRRPYMRTLEDLYGRDADPQVPQSIARHLSIPVERAKELHLNMLVFTTGIGVIMATGSRELPEEEMLARLESACQAFLGRAMEE